MRRIIVWTIIPLAALAGCETTPSLTDVSADTSVGSPPSRAELVWLPSAVSVGGPAASAVAPVRALAVSGGTVVYDAVPDPAPASWPSFSFQDTGTDEWGDHVVLSETGTLGVVRVGLSSWACENDAVRAPAEACETTPGSSFSHPVTLSLYGVDLSGSEPALGPLLASRTQVLEIPFRPSWSSSCLPPAFDAPYGGQWYDATAGQCVSGLSVVVEFDFSGAGVTLPEQLIYGIAFATESHGNSPLGAPGPWNRLTVGVANTGPLPGPTVGSDAEPDYTFWDTDLDFWYCDGGAGGVDVFRRDGCWGGLTPVVEIELGSGDDEGPVTSDVTVASSVVLVGSTVDAGATVDDAGSGGSAVALAEIQVVGVGASPQADGWQPAAAADGSFDSPSESVVASVTADAPGTLQVCIRGTDAGGNVGAPACVPLVAVDPGAGPVTANGWIWNEDIRTPSDGVHFDVRGRYRKGSSIPTGWIRVRDRTRGLDFRTSGMDWMVVADDGTATLAGWGVLDGAPVMVEARVGEGTGPDGADTFGVRIQAVGGDEAVVLDTGGTMPLGGGEVLVRRR